ncbi:tRNA (adenine-N(1)-)-methyltransferase catalytic subunit trm61, partial [Coemansia sp. S142-1]
MFHQYKAVIEDGDLVVVYLNPENMLTATVKTGGVLNNKYGSFRHDDMIGLKYGSM